MKIAHIVENYYSNPFGGIATWTRRLIEYLNYNGITNQIYAYDHGIPADLPKIIKSTPNVRELFVYPYLGKKITANIERQFDIIHFASPLTTSRYRANTRTVISGHYIVSRQSQLLRKYLPYPYKAFFNPLLIKMFEFIERSAYWHGDVIIVPRQEFKSYLMDKYKLPADRFTLVKWGIDLNKFNITKEYEKREKIALFVGRGTPAKGFDVFLKAAKQINGKLLAVASPIMSKEKQLLSKLDNVEIIYGLDDREMAQVYNRCSVFVMPSLSESGPLTTFEAMACGLPVVCTREGSGGRIEDGHNGFVIDFGDHNKLAEKVNYLFENTKTAAEFGNRNRQIVEQDHSLDGMCFQIKKVYENIWNQK